MTTSTASLNLDGNFEAGAERAARAGEKLASTMGRLGAAAARAGGVSIGDKSMAGRSPWAAAPPASIAAGAARAGAAAGNAQRSAYEKAAGKPLEVREAGSASAKYLAKQAGIGKAAMRAPVAAAAVDMTKLALGIKGMAQLDALEARTALKIRGLFSGVNPAPVIRGAERFAQVFDKSSATGKALEGIFNRSFNSLFGLLEKAAPYAQTAFQAMVLGALYLEEGWLRARIALFPLTSAIEDMVSPTDRMRIAAVAGGLALGALGIAATGAAAPFIIAAGAVGSLIANIQALKAEMSADGEGAKMNAGMVRVFGEGSEQANRAYGVHAVSAEEAAATHAKFLAGKGATDADYATVRVPGARAADGQADGAAFATGVAKGMGDGASAVDAAGHALADVADGGFRAGAKIMSPSRRAYDSAAYIPEGAANAIDEGRGDVQAAANRMAPQMGPMGAGGAGPGGRGGLVVHAPVSVVVQGGADASIEARIAAAVRQGVAESWREIAQVLGVSLELAPT